MTHDPQLVHTTKDADATSALWNDRYIAYIPLLGAAVALTFDVGCFYAIEINLFTLFSLFEHIVFAIQAFPIALAMLIPMSGMMVVMGREAAASSSNDHDTIRTVPGVTAYIVLIILIVVLITLASFLIAIISSTTPELLLVVIELVVLGFGMFFIKISYKRLFITLMAIMITLTISFSFGFGAGRSYLSNNYIHNIFAPSFSGDVIKLKSGEMLSGRIIRSGDRGLLFYDPVSSRLYFLLWVAIGSIETTPQKATMSR